MKHKLITKGFLVFLITVTIILTQMMFIDWNISSCVESPSRSLNWFRTDYERSSSVFFQGFLELITSVEEGNLTKTEMLVRVKMLLENLDVRLNKLDTLLTLELCRYLCFTITETGLFGESPIPEAIYFGKLVNLFYLNEVGISGQCPIPEALDFSPLTDLFYASKLKFTYNQI